MKAIVVRQFGDPEVLKLEEVADPEPLAHQVVVRVKAAGVNPVETYIRSGKYARTPHLPYTPGTDAGGIIENAGTGVRNYKPGDRVYVYGSLTGTYAELALCEENQVHPLPDSCSFAQGAAIGIPVGAAWRALFHRGKAQSGQTVLVHGATGGVGLATVQLAAAAKLTVVATTSNSAAKPFLSEQGAHYILGHDEANEPERIHEITNGRGFDLIIEMLANVNLNHDLRVLAPHGRVLIVGSRGKIEIDPRDILAREIDICGVFLPLATADELQSMHQAFHQVLANRTLCPIIGKEYPLAQAPQAHQDILQPHEYGKLILLP